MNSQQEHKSSDGQIRVLDAVLIYTACVSGLGIALLLWSLSQLSSFSRSVLLFIGLVVIAELTTSAVFVPQMVFSMSSAVTFATLFLFGPLPAGLVVMVGDLVTQRPGEIALSLYEDIGNQ